MTSAEKDTIYIDVDDEITSIVEKLKNSSHKIVALVLPKRALVLQSVVNLKLLRRAANDSGKRVVLITSDPTLLSMAGAIGMYTAKNLNSKPEIPDAPDVEYDVDEVDADMEDIPIDSSKSVGELAGDESEPEPTNVPDKVKKTSSKKVPNFEKFRLQLFIGIGVFIGIVLFWWWGAVVAPKAKIIIESDTETLTPTINFTADKTATSVNKTDNILPASFVEKTQTVEQKGTATGQKDISAKASGTVTFSKPCGPENPPTIPSGTSLSAESLTYVTQSSVTLSPVISNGCKFQGSAKVIAQNKGEQYNIEATTYTFSGFSGVTASGTAMTGGSSKTVKVVSQQDIDATKQKVDESSSQIKDQLKQQLEQNGYFAIVDSFEITKDTTQVTPALDQEATEFTIKGDRTYTMTGVKKDDLKQLIEQAVAKEQQGDAQKITNDGIDNAVYRVLERKSNSIKFTMQPTVTTGANIQNDTIKKDVAGKKKGETENAIKAISGVKSVEVKYSPFWVTKTPKNTNKITIELKKAQ